MPRTLRTAEMLGVPLPLRMIVVCFAIVPEFSTHHRQPPELASFCLLMTSSTKDEHGRRP
jgi:hypothetical protein